VSVVMIEKESRAWHKGFSHDTLSPDYVGTASQSNRRALKMNGVVSVKE